MFPNGSPEYNQGLKKKKNKLKKEKGEEALDNKFSV